MSQAEELDLARGEIAALQAEVARLKAQLGPARGAKAYDDSAMLRSLLRALPAFVLWTGADLKLRFVNRVAAGFSLDEAIGRSLFDFIPPDEQEPLERAVADVIRRGVTRRLRMRGQGDRAEIVDYETTLTPLDHEDGSRSALVVSFDVTEQAERERALSLSRDRLRVAVEATGVGFWEWNLSTNEVSWDPRTCEIMGLDVPYAGDAYLEKAVHPDDRAHVGRVTLEILNGLPAVSITYRVVRPDGEVRWVLSSGTVETDDRGKPRRLVGGHLDITQTRDLEHRLRQRQRMEALGTLTAGVAHNFNNLLAVVLPSLDIAADHASGEAATAIEDARMASERAADVVRQLMTFSGRQEAAARPLVALDDLLRSVARLCRRSLDSSVALELVDLPPNALVEGDATELEQVLVNLICNARDALAGSPTPSPRIVVTLERAERAPDGVDPARAPRGYYRAGVRDNGPGVAPRVRQRIFEPFFTTKGPDGGTGLGLAMAWAVLRACGGSIEVEDAPGGGALFFVYLPRAERASGRASARAAAAPTARATIRKDPDSAPESAAASRSPRSRTGDSEREPSLRVLLVEDIGAVRRVTSRLLELAGHVVSEATSAAEALRVAARGEHDCVLLDQSLPDGRGVGIVGELRALQPRARILLFTGESVSAEDRALVDGVVSKPTASKALVAALRGDRSERAEARQLRRECSER